MGSYFRFAARQAYGPANPNSTRGFAAFGGAKVPIAPSMWKPVLLTRAPRQRLICSVNPNSFVVLALKLLNVFGVLDQLPKLDVAGSNPLSRSIFISFPPGRYAFFHPEQGVPTEAPHRYRSILGFLSLAG